MREHPDPWQEAAGRLQQQVVDTARGAGGALSLALGWRRLTGAQRVVRALAGEARRLEDAAAAHDPGATQRSAGTTGPGTTPPDTTGPGAAAGPGAAPPPRPATAPSATTAVALSFPSGPAAARTTPAAVPRRAPPTAPPGPARSR